MERTIISPRNAQMVIDDGDMVLFRALPVAEQESVGPFVFLDHYRHQSRRGIGDKPHPHAGIEVLSYLLDGGVEHRDSQGYRDTLGPGDAQFIKAGRGILHAEQPLSGRHGLQLWTSLPASEKFSEPTYTSIRAADIPEVQTPGVRVKVVAGKVAGVTGPMKLTMKTTFAVVHLQGDARAHFEVDPEEELGIYVLQGAIEGANKPIGSGGFAMLSKGSQITLKNADQSGETIVALVGGEPAEQPIFFSGPFVMDSPENLMRADQDYKTGKMGQLDGVPF